MAPRRGPWLQLVGTPWRFSFLWTYPRGNHQIGRGGGYKMSIGWDPNCLPYPYVGWNADQREQNEEISQDFNTEYSPTPSSKGTEVLWGSGTWAKGSPVLPHRFVNLPEDREWSNSSSQWEWRPTFCAEKATAKNPSLWLSLKRISQQVECTQWGMSYEHSQHPPEVHGQHTLLRTKAILGDLRGRLQASSCTVIRESELIPLGRCLPPLSSVQLGSRQCFCSTAGGMTLAMGGIWQTDLWALQGRARILVVSTSRVQMWWWTEIHYKAASIPVTSMCRSKRSFLLYRND